MTSTLFRVGMLPACRVGETAIPRAGIIMSEGELRLNDIPRAEAFLQRVSTAKRLRVGTLFSSNALSSEEAALENHCCGPHTSC